MQGTPDKQEKAVPAADEVEKAAPAAAEEEKKEEVPAPAVSGARACTWTCSVPGSCSCSQRPCKEFVSSVQAGLRWHMSGT